MRGWPAECGASTWTTTRFPAARVTLYTSGFRSGAMVRSGMPTKLGHPKVGSLLMKSDASSVSVPLAFRDRVFPAGAEARDPVKFVPGGIGVGSPPQRTKSLATEVLLVRVAAPPDPLPH